MTSASKTETRADPRMALLVTAIGQFMALLDTNNINIALPSILKELHASLSSGQLVVFSKPGQGRKRRLVPASHTAQQGRHVAGGGHRLSLQGRFQRSPVS